MRPVPLGEILNEEFLKPLGLTANVLALCRRNLRSWALAQSKVTAQGQISVPAEVRQKLGIGPGSVLEWDEEGDSVVVRKAGRHTSEDIHGAIFGRRAPAAKKVEEFDEGMRRYMKKKHARR